MNKLTSSYSQPSGNTIRQVLYNLLNGRFNINEINELCFRLDIDHENLQSTTKGEKARELVSLMERRDALAALSEAIRELRPDVSVQLDELLEQTEMNTIPQNDNLGNKDVRPIMGRVEALLAPLRLTLEGELGTGKWDLFVTNESDAEVRRVNVVMRPSSAVIVAPNTVSLGTIPAGQTKQASNALVIRPNQAEHDEHCVLSFEAIYATPNTKPNRYKSEFQIPITGN